MRSSLLCLPCLVSASLLLAAGCHTNKGGAVLDTGQPDDTGAPGDTDDPVDTNDPGDTDDTQEECTVAAILEASPEDGAEWVSRSAVVELEVDGNPTEAETTFTLTDGSGGEVAVEATLEEGWVAFTPDEMLEAETDYEWTTSVCGVEAEGSFTTGNYGEYVEPDDVGEAAYAIDITDGTWLEPEGAGSWISYLFSGYILLGVEDISEDEVDVILGVGEESRAGEVEQDLCTQTVDFDPVSFEEDPYFEAEAEVLYVTAEGYTAGLYFPYLRTAFTPGGLGLGDGMITGQMDMRDVEESGSYCDYVAYLGWECVSCETDGEPYCLDIHVEDLEGSWVEGLVVEEVEDPGPDCG